MKEPKRAFLGVWIPKEIWLSDSLSLPEKIMLVEISSLDNDDGCFASNSYFSSFFGLSKTRVSEIIKSLTEKGYITSLICYKKGTRQIEKRVLKIADRYLENRIGGIRKTEGGYSENCKDNNININNIYVAPSEEGSTKDKKKKLFEHDSDPYKLAKYLAKAVEDNFAKKKLSKQYTEPDIQRWAKDIDLLIRINKAKPDDIADVIDWCQDDEFWSKNILSGKSLRSHYDSLLLKAK